MELNADFSKRVLIHTDTAPWQASPMAGVDRRMLDRIGAEVARATSIVRYAPGSQFSAHTHGGGEEFIVLSGVFQDEHGDYPAGTYVRNPPTSSHTPGAAAGCIIFVKLWQFDPNDRTQFRRQIGDDLTAAAPGVMGQILHHDNQELVRYFDLQSGSTLTLGDAGGTEILMLAGLAETEHDNLREGSWLRLPDGQGITLKAGEQGAQIWVKTGHLVHAAAPTQT